LFSEAHASHFNAASAMLRTSALKRYT
jgi:hypothetical protein